MVIAPHSAKKAQQGSEKYQIICKNSPINQEVGIEKSVNECNNRVDPTHYKKQIIDSKSIYPVMSEINSVSRVVPLIYKDQVIDSKEVTLPMSVTIVNEWYNFLVKLLKGKDLGDSTKVFFSKLFAYKKTQILPLTSVVSCDSQITYRVTCLTFPLIAS